MMQARGLLLRLLLIIIVAFLFQPNVKAQLYSFGNYSVKEGLIQSNVQSITQDKAGYLWIGTDGGLSRFDGKDFVSFSTQNGLQEAGIKTLSFDKSGVLWIGHATGKITTYANNRFQNFLLKKEDSGFRIHQILCDSKDRLWVCTQGNGVYRIDPKNKQSYTRLTSKEGLTEEVFKAFEDQQGGIWFITYVGIKYLNPKTGEISFFKPGGLPFYTFTCIAEDYNQNLWLGTLENGLIKYNTKTGERKEYNTSNGLASNFITSVILSADSSIWAGSWKTNESSGELIQVQNDNLRTISAENGLPGEKVICLFSDQHATIWAGLYNKGLARFRGFTFSHYNTGAGIRNEVVNCVTLNQNFVWAGTDDGIDRFEPTSNGTMRFINHINTAADLGSGLVTAFQKINNTIVVSTFRGDIGFYNPAGKLLKSLSINNKLMNTLSVSDNNTLWIGSVNGLTGYDIKSGEFKSYFKSEEFNILSILPYGNGLLLGTREAGLILFNGKEFIKDPEGLSIQHRSPVVLGMQPNGTLWIGTEGGGVYYGKKNALKNLRVSDGLTSDYITSISFAEHDKVIIATNKGICLIDTKDDKPTIRQYQEPEGLLYPEIAINSTVSGIHGLFYGTASGMGHFYFRSNENNEPSAKVILNGIRIFSELHEGTEYNELSYDQKEITFLFSAINLNKPERTKFRYRLNGFDKTWQNTVELTNAHYTNLSPGDYEFIVEVSNGNDRWSANSAHYPFRVKPPFWQTTWFIASVLLLLIVSVWGFVFFRTRYLERTKKILETEVAERTYEIQLQNINLEEANKLISNKNKEITDSINYAKKIQDAILPGALQLRQHYPHSFIYFKPKDIVSGDFYWIFNEDSSNNLLQGITRSNGDLNSREKGRTLIAVADCTGHGVPGAFMCMIGSSLLNQIVQENWPIGPEKILGLLNSGIQNALRQTETETQDGMDIALVEIDSKDGWLHFAGAMRPMILMRGEAYRKRHQIAEPVYMEEIKPDKTPIGGIHGKSNKDFTRHSLKLWESDVMYLFTDGFADQFGGKSGKKLMTRKFKDLIAEIHTLPMNEQHRRLDLYMKQWKGDYFQVDDMLVLGIKYIPV